MSIRFLNLQFGDAFWTKFFEELSKTADWLWEHTKSKKFKGKKAYWEKVEIAIDRLLNKRPISIPRFARDPPLDFLVCVDEARNFQKMPEGCKWDLLMQLNRAARLLPNRSLFLFMDTLSDLNVIYPKKAFPSDRSMLMERRPLSTLIFSRGTSGARENPSERLRTFSSPLKQSLWPCMVDLFGPPC